MGIAFLELAVLKNTVPKGCSDDKIVTGFQVPEGMYHCMSFSDKSRSGLKSCAFLGSCSAEIQDLTTA